MSDRRRRAPTIVVLIAAISPVVIACGPMPSGTAAPASGPGAIDHPMGAGDLILRLSSGGGFAGLEMRPTVSLYGDGTLVFRDPGEATPPALGTVRRAPPWRAVRLAESEVQRWLADALDSGLRNAAAHYSRPGADFFTTEFRLRAAGLDRTVSVFGLELPPEPGQPDSAIFASLAGFAGRLTTFVGNLDGTPPWEPTGYHATIWRAGAGEGPARPWPWPELRLEDFEAGQQELQLVRVMAPAEVAAIGIEGYEGGLEGLIVVAPDGDPYRVRVRPLLPDEVPPR